MNKEAPIFTPDPDGRPVLVTGASGSMGFKYVERLSLYTPVKAMARRDRDIERLNQIPNVKAIKADMEDFDSLKRATENVSKFFHLAANLSITDMETNIRVNREGTERLALAANENGVEHAHLISSVGVYGDQINNKLVPEYAPRNAKNAYGSTKRDQEDILLDGSNRFTTSIVRPANVIGAETDPWAITILNGMQPIELAAIKDDAIRNAALKTFGRVGFKKLSLPLSVLSFVMTYSSFPYVELENVIDLSIKASQDPKVVGQAFNAVDANASWPDIISTYAPLLGKRIRHAPEWLRRGILCSIDTTLNELPLPENSRLKQIKSYIFEGQTYSSEKADRLLEHDHRITLAESVEQTRKFITENGLPRSKQIYLNLG